MTVRDLMRIVVLLGLAFMVLYNDYSSLKGQYGGQQVIDESFIYSRVELVFGNSPHLHPYETIAQGSLWSMQVHRFRISDPLAVLSSPGDLWWTAILPVLVALGLGRVFCSWICPMGLLSDITATLRRIAGRYGIQFFSLKLSSKLKYVVLAVGVLFSVGLSVSFFYPIYPPRIICDFIRDLLVGELQVYGIAFIGGLILVELLFVDRFWCRCLCPGGALYSLLGKVRLLRVRRNELNCDDCGECDIVCPHQLAPSHLSLGGECDNCGLCKTKCPADALHFTFARQTGTE